MAMARPTQAAADLAAARREKKKRAATRRRANGPDCKGTERTSGRKTNGHKKDATDWEDRLLDPLFNFLENLKDILGKGNGDYAARRKDEAARRSSL